MSRWQFAGFAFGIICVLLMAIWLAQILLPVLLIP